MKPPPCALYIIHCAPLHNALHGRARRIGHPTHAAPSWLRRRSSMFLVVCCRATSQCLIAYTVLCIALRGRARSVGHPTRAAHPWLRIRRSMLFVLCYRAAAPCPIPGTIYHLAEGLARARAKRRPPDARGAPGHADEALCFFDLGCRAIALHCFFLVVRIT